MPSRIAKLVLVTPDGTIVGTLPPVAASTPWWSHAEPVVQAIKEQFGHSVTILRLLEADKNADPFDHGGNVTYLAEIDEAVPAEPWNGTLDEHPLRHPYAKVGGPKIDLDWATSVLASQNIQITGEPVQIRSWNLSSIWRIPTRNETIWLKVVPPFFAHEGRIMEAMQDFPVPQMLAHDKGRVLLKEIPGIDMYDADDVQLCRMVDTLVDIQSHWNDRTDELLAMGLPDWRGPSLSEKIIDVIDRTADQLTQDELKTLRRFTDTLLQRFADIALCGMEDTLVHGDFHRGNVRANDEILTILDWGDSGVGHPLLDQAAFFERCSDETRLILKDHWNREWLKREPDCDPEKAATLLVPIAYARQAVIYRMFMDNIEPAEHRYHQADPARWLRRAVVQLEQG